MDVCAASGLPGRVYQGLRLLRSRTKRNRNGKNRGVVVVMAIAGAVCTSPLSRAWTLTSPVGTVQAPYVLNHQSNIACNGDCPMGDQGGILKVQNPNGPVWQQQQTVSVGPMSMNWNQTVPVPGSGSWGTGIRNVVLFDTAADGSPIYISSAAINMTQ